MRYTQFTGATWNMDRAMLDSWTPENQSNTMPKLGGRRVEPNSMFSSRYIKDGSYLRVKNIQLGYTFPEALSSKAKIQRFRVYVSANNLYTFTNYDGADPEISQSGRGSLDIGVDRGIYPQPRTIMFGVNLSF